MKKQTLKQKIDQVPCRLKSTQQWFAEIITSRLEPNEKIQSYTPSGNLIAEEASRYITPSSTLRSHERMQIYNQQYWWRLLNTLHANFPLVTRLFGYLAFNEKIGIPYLLRYPPNHWSLNELGERLPKWVAEYYHEPDQSLILHAAYLDWAFMASFIAPHYTPLNPSEFAKEDPVKILSSPLYLQPHVTLFTWEYDLFTFREHFLKQEVDYWLEHRFPDLPKGKTYYFILYRNSRNNLSWREINQPEFILLEQFKKGSSITKACEHIEKKGEKLYESVAKDLQKWVQEWTQLGWLTLQSE